MTNLGQMYPPPGSPSEHFRKPKLCRDTYYNDANRVHVISGRFVHSVHSMNQEQSSVKYVYWPLLLRGPKIRLSGTDINPLIYCPHCPKSGITNFGFFYSSTAFLSKAKIFIYRSKFISVFVTLAQISTFVRRART